MKKILKVALPILLVGFFVAITICYSLYPEQTLQFAEKLKEFANQPLPIAGFSTLTIGGLLFLIIRYIISNSNFGKAKLQEMKTELENAKKELADEQSKTRKLQAYYKEEIDYYKSATIEGLKLIPNKKVQDYVANIEKVDSAFNQKIKEIDERINEYVGKEKERIDNKTEEI